MNVQAACHDSDDGMTWKVSWKVAGNDGPNGTLTVGTWDVGPSWDVGTHLLCCLVVWLSGCLVWLSASCLRFGWGDVGFVASGTFVRDPPPVPASHDLRSSNHVQDTKPSC